MTSDTRNRLLDAVHRRALALAKLTAPDSACRSVNPLLAMSARNLFGTVIALCGPALHEEWMRRLFKRELSNQAICPVCEQHDMADGEFGMCESCYSEGLREDEDVQQAVLMAQPNKGQVN